MAIKIVAPACTETPPRPFLLDHYALERGLWVGQDILRAELPKRFGYVRSPQKAQAGEA